jgi:alpha-tubulin suppressor-like RCC1 family protein
MTLHRISPIGRVAVLAALLTAVAACRSSSSPPAGGGDTVAALALGYSFSCARSGAGAVKCWGSNGSGQLGGGALDPAYSVTPLRVSALASVTTIGAGQFHACAVAGEAVTCWGNNECGEIGLDPATFTSATTPVTVAGAAGATALIGGEVHTCAIMGDRRVKCWGYNADGELGVATPSRSPDPVYVTSLTNVVGLAAGTVHSCAVLDDGRVKCWGSNSGDQLGNPSVPGGTASAHSADPVLAGTLTTAVQVAAGEVHTCARLSSGRVSCWGTNTFGVLGRTSGGGPDPVEVTSISGATAIASGNTHVCALLADRTVKCWGYNYYGQLGNAAVGGPSWFTPDPVSVTSLSEVTGIAAGQYHTCAMLAAGGVRCWGRNDSGQIGDGTPFDAGF